MENIFEEIEQERELQDKQWGGITHDDNHSFSDWIAFIVKHLGKAVLDYKQPAEVREGRFRYQMIRIAALAIAAIQATERRVQAIKG